MEPCSTIGIHVRFEKIYALLRKSEASIFVTVKTGPYTFALRWWVIYSTSPKMPPRKFIPKGISVCQKSSFDTRVTAKCLCRIWLLPWGEAGGEAD